MLSSTTHHALRAMAILAASTTGHEPVLGRDLSAGAGVPLTYLSKILVSLAKAGFLQASRGPKGGYRLARAYAVTGDYLAAEPDCIYQPVEEKSQ